MTVTLSFCRQLEQSIDQAIDAISKLEMEKIPSLPKKLQSLFMTAHKVHLGAREALQTINGFPKGALIRVKEDAKSIKTEIRNLIKIPNREHLFYHFIEDHLQSPEGLPNDLFRNILKTCSEIPENQFLETSQQSVSDPNANQS